MSTQMKFAITVMMVLMGLSLLGGCHSSSNSNNSGGGLISAPTAGVTLSDVFAQLPSFTRPILALQAPLDNSQWYVVEQTGHVRRFNNGTSAVTVVEVIDISDRVDSASGNEMGLLGMAFHPNFPSDPRVFLSYTATVSGQFISRVSAFTSTDGGLTLNKNSENILLTVNQPAGENNHKGGNLIFGANGYLYIGFGDGGGGGDMHGTIGNGQNLNTLLGKVLRIDVGLSTDTTYTVPLTNSFIGNPLCGIAGGTGSQACPEIYAYGFRNPWRFNFDHATDVLWVADVGQGAWEEIDVVTLGGNYGWRCYEGNHAYNTSGCTGTYIPPVAEYDHTQGDAAIIGGYVYHGAASTKTQGKYIYGDEITGRIWSMPAGLTGGARTELIHSSYSISSFAQGNDGELYITNYANGRIYKLIFN